MIEHSPLPWEARQHINGSHWFIDYQDSAEDGYTLADELSEGDAQFIALAANTHKQLMEAAKIGRDLVRTVLYQHPDDEIAQLQQEIIETVLAQVEAKP